jgi:hypothetical protein
LLSVYSGPPWLCNDIWADTTTRLALAYSTLSFIVRLSSYASLLTLVCSKLDIPVPFPRPFLVAYLMQTVGHTNPESHIAHQGDELFPWWVEEHKSEW